MSRQGRSNGTAREGGRDWEALTRARDINGRSTLTMLTSREQQPVMIIIIITTSSITTQYHYHEYCNIIYLM